MISEKEFKSVLNTIWSGFSKSTGLINLLEGMGLLVNPSELNNGCGPQFGDLYKIQGNMSYAPMNLLGIRSADHPLLIGELDQFFADTYSNYPDYDDFPEEAYSELLDIIRNSGVELPWEKKSQFAPDMENFFRHRALSKADMKPVVGYLWNGNDHAYIIPYNYGVDYDKDNQRLTACAIEVWKPTIALEMQIQSVNYQQLFEGDLVRIGDDAFHLKLNDLETMKKLESPECKTLGLFLVKPNYHGFTPPAV